MIAQEKKYFKCEVTELGGAIKKARKNTQHLHSALLYPLIQKMGANKKEYWASTHQSRSMSSLMCCEGQTPIKQSIFSSYIYVSPHPIASLRSLASSSLLLWRIKYTVEHRLVRVAHRAAVRPPVRRRRGGDHAKDELPHHRDINARLFADDSSHSGC